MDEMTEPDGKDSRGEFEYSEAALDQWYASRRRYIRPVLVLGSTLLLIPVMRKWELAGVVLLCLAVSVIFVMVAQNYVIERRADKRLKAEKHEWEAKHARPS